MSSETGAARPASTQRTDIQVLRALAVGGVVVNHLVPNRLTGGYLGVDIFFVISGFLITSHLTRELARTGRIRLATFWARRARRLLPASLLVLALTAVATWYWLPQAVWDQVFSEIAASALYFQNWELAWSAQDYFSSSQAASPVTHYWSLSVEEQFYLVWPLLAMGAWWLARRFGVDARRALVGTLLVLAVTSFAYAQWSVQAQPSQAYFVTPGRVWEFALGGALGAMAPRALPRWTAGLGWIVMIGSMFVFDAGSSVPGGLTALPVLGCLVVLWAGLGSGESTRLALRPLSWVGDVSYAIYLWHWPLIIFVPIALGRPMGLGLALLVLVLTAVAAQVSTRWVETPIRTGRWFATGPSWRSLVPTLALSAVVAGTAWWVPSTTAGDLAGVQKQLQQLVDSGGPCVGAPAADNNCSDSHVLSVANSDLVTIVNSPYLPSWGGTCQVEPEDSVAAGCQFGVPPEEASARLALVGDSHAGQWSTVLDRLAVKNRWNVLMHVKSSCALSRGGWHAAWATEPMQKSCRAWNEQVLEEIVDDPTIDVVVVSAISRSYVSEDADGGRSELRGLWSELVDSGKQVLVIGDPPALGNGAPPACLGSTSETRDPCSVPRKTITGDPLLAAAKDLDGVSSWSPMPYVCSDTNCHAVVGGLPVYGDENHLLHYFTQTFAGILDPVLGPLLGQASDQGQTQAKAQTSGR